ncbi:hypothetical protein BGI40_01430 [Snodgrassella communis]|jgi:hypothetical protein|nr:hypothetical protein [Snodgrassella communis]PIT10737.1 hypothetical protein BGI29_01870 [Snodgrassella communis]PIT20124.1 hypothetical protein BGI35_09145 [Snodgrassella communis]PIT28148.1 hypothetical protein BGI38_05005 [Snodgrassella communis]PIT30413.1 hypothetical protein BGI39_00670 [Snodgrassella communis]PIT37074.1 hypothetical protein BGI40_01430 [Snodgrassella communis]
MAMIQKWPARLPVPDVDYSYSLKSPFMRTTLNSGRARQRRISNNSPTEVQVTWKIKWADMADFRYFVHEIVGQQSGWGFFLTPLAFEEHKKMVKARFINSDQPYEAVNDSNVFWVVSAKLETYDASLITYDEFIKRNPEFS